MITNKYIADSIRRQKDREDWYAVRDYVNSDTDTPFIIPSHLYDQGIDTVEKVIDYVTSNLHCK